MSSKGVTEGGKRRFGQAVRAARGRILREDGSSLSQADFAVWLTEKTEIKVGPSQINTLEAGFWTKSIAPDTLIAIVEAEILKFPDGKPFSLEDCVDVMRERISLTGERIAPPVEANR